MPLTSHKPSHLLFQKAFRSNELIKDVFTNVGVDGRKWIVEQVNGCTVVDCTSQAYPLFLTSRKVDPLYERQNRFVTKN